MKVYYPAAFTLLPLSSSLSHAQSRGGYLSCHEDTEEAYGEPCMVKRKSLASSLLGTACPLPCERGGKQILQPRSRLKGTAVQPLPWLMWLHWLGVVPRSGSSPVSQSMFLSHINVFLPPFLLPFPSLKK